MNNYAVTHNTEFCQQKNRFTLKCGTRLSLSDLERAGVSYVPCGQVDGQDTPLLKYAHLWGNRKQVTLDSYGKNANSWTLSDMTGAQIMTGYPTFKPSADSPSVYLHLTDIDIEKHLLETHPEIVNRIMRVYRESCEGTPCVIQTKSDGRRLSAFSAYLDNKREFKDAADKMLLEIFSIKGLSRLDHRYGILEGNILDLPSLPKSALQKIHGIISEVATERKRESKDRQVVETSQIGDLKIDWNDNGKSQYFPASHCQTTSHKNSERETVQFSKVSNGGVQGYCFNCGESWWEIKPKLQSRRASIRLSHQPDYTPESQTLDTLREALPKGLMSWDARTHIYTHHDFISPLIKDFDLEKCPRGKRHEMMPGWWDHREVLMQLIENKQHMLILAYGAGTGKSTAAIVNLKAYRDISPTLELADEKYETALQNNKNAMRHRSRNYNREASENYTPESVPIGLDANNSEVPCIYPDICNGLAQNGYSPSKTFCPLCPRFDECRVHGYLAQWDLMPNFEAVFFSYQDDFFSDPQYMSYIQNITEDINSILVLDEVDPASLPPRRGYITEYLKQMAYDYREFDAGIFLAALIKETSTATTPIAWATALTGVLDKFTTADLNAVDIELEGIPVDVSFEDARDVEVDLRGESLYRTIAHITYRGMKRTCAVLSKREGEKELPISAFEQFTKEHLDGWISDNIYPSEGWQQGCEYSKLLTINTFCRLGFGTMDTPESVSELPKRLTNFTADLRAFVDTLKSDTPACHEDIEGKGHVGWTYYLRPSMNARRGVIISASGVEGIIKELYNHTGIGIETLQGKPPAWKANNAIFQLSTGRYTPSQSLIEKENQKAIALKDRGVEMMQIIATESENGKATLVVGAKDFTSEGDLTHVPEIANLLAMPNVSVINHWHAEGVNKYEHCENAFIFLYEPRPDEIEKIASRIYRNDTLCFDREKTTLKKAGVELEDVYRYNDPRIQAVYDRECEKRLMQSITRLRQMIHEGKRVYLLTAEPVSGLPVTPTLFTIADLKGCQAEHDTLDDLEVYIDAKENLSIKEASKLDGVSERTAYKRTEKQRANTKAEKKAEAYRLYNQHNMTLTEIASFLGVKSHTTIARWIESHKS